MAFIPAADAGTQTIELGPANVPDAAIEDLAVAAAGWFPSALAAL